MDVIEEQEINAETSAKRLLIASQGSEFKNTIVDGLIEKLSHEDIHIKVIDVTTISKEDADVWDAILIMHTWEKWEPQEDAKEFLDAHYDPDRMVVVATSGSGEQMIEGVDGISAASILDKTDETIDALYVKIRLILGIN